MMQPKKRLCVGTSDKYVQKMLAKWKGRHISIGGRVNLINPVLCNLPIYHLYFYKIPVKVQ